jgi:CRISPR-associated protein (TIGR02584 family)
MSMQPAIHEQVAPRRILLAVTGLTPQIVTETIYALLREGRDALPHEVHILTTTEGAQRARLALLSEKPGWFHRLLADYSLAPIDFGPENIHVLHDASGAPLADIRSAADNACAADQVAEWVRRLTQDAGQHLHVSLAGGRKTLGFFAGYALSLWGRDGDRLTHVLVSEPYESSWDFFYPTPYERIIEARNGKLADCRQAEVTLADLPFVRLRHGLPSTLLSGQAGFAEAVHAAQVRLGPPRLHIDLGRQCIEAAGKPIGLAPAELAFLAWFARRARQGLPGVPCPPDGAPSPEHAAAYLAEYRRIRGVLGDDGRSAARYRRGMAKADFEERKSKLKRVLQAALGPAAQPYLIVGEGRRPMRFRLALAGDEISFAG